jgi:ABC-type multidrug transport system ATPase subunit
VGQVFFCNARCPRAGSETPAGPFHTDATSSGFQERQVLVDALTVRGLTRRYGSSPVLHDISFSLPQGRILVVLGPNGSGKTTLLRCIVGADRPDAGSVHLGNRPFDETDPAVRASVASALDDMDFFPDLSVREHLELLSFAHGGDGRGVSEVLGELDLEPAQDQLPATLSSGQRRRLALASCFVRPRRLLVLDEPEQRLDTRGREWLADRLLREKTEGTSVLMASHDAELVQRVADLKVDLQA